MSNVPNIITCIRFILTALFAVVFLTLGQGMIAGIVFLLIGFSDVLDGFIARKYNLISRTGEALDPLADKFMVITVVICLFIEGIINIWIPIAFLVKDLLMIIGGIVMMKTEKKVLSANIFGKAAALLFFAVTFAAVCFVNINISLINTLLTISFVISFGASFTYFILALRKKYNTK